MQFVNTFTTIQDLVETALCALQKVEKLPEYTIDMSAWHHERDKDTNAVSLAGCVMVHTFKLKHITTYTPLTIAEMYSEKDAKWCELGEYWKTTLLALDDLAQGDFRPLLKHFKVYHPEIELAMSVIYSDWDIKAKGTLHLYRHPELFQKMLIELIEYCAQRNI